MGRFVAVLAARESGGCSAQEPDQGGGPPPGPGRVLRGAPPALPRTLPLQTAPLPTRPPSLTGGTELPIRARCESGWPAWASPSPRCSSRSRVESGAYFLDKDRNFDGRLRAYSQLGIMARLVGEGLGAREVSAGDLAQHRNFYNPEFDAKLTPYTRWMGSAPGLSLVAPDEFEFRFAWWGFYDGLYDYLNGPWNDNRRSAAGRASRPATTPATRATTSTTSARSRVTSTRAATASTSCTSITRRAGCSSASAGRRSRGASRTPSRCSTPPTRST